MKRFVIIIILLITIIGVVLIISNSNKAGYTEITLNEFTQKIENNETFVFVLAQTTCTACQAYEANTLHYYDKDVPIYLFNFDKEFSSSDQVYQFLEDYNLEIQRWYPDRETVSTPTSYAIKNGQATNAIIGAVDLSKLNTFIESEIY